MSDRIEPHLLNLPSEVRLCIYKHVFEFSILFVCGIKHNTHHLNVCLPYKGQHVCSALFPYQITQTCRQIRMEALPCLLQTTMPSCCHMGFNLVEKLFSATYTANIRKLSVDLDSFTSTWIRSYRPDVEHRRCRALPALPQLRVLTLRIGRCFRLDDGFAFEDFSPTMILSNGKTLTQQAADELEGILRRAPNSFLVDTLNNANRGFRVHINTYIADFHPKPAGEAGIAVRFVFDWDGDVVGLWRHESTPTWNDGYRAIERSWYRERGTWEWLTSPFRRLFSKS